MTKCGAINRPSSTVYKYVHVKINNIHTYSTPKYYPLYYLHYSQNWLSLVKRNIFHKSVIFLTGILKTPNIGIYIVKYLCLALTLSIQLSGESLNFTYGQLAFTMGRASLMLLTPARQGSHHCFTFKIVFNHLLVTRKTVWFQ